MLGRMFARMACGLATATALVACDDNGSGVAGDEGGIGGDDAQQGGDNGAMVDAGPEAEAGVVDWGRTKGADRVLVVYNGGWPNDDDKDGVQDSKEIADYYVAQRGVPPVNVVALPCTTGTDASAYTDYARFRTEIIAPIQAKLAALGPTSIDVLLMAYGMPLAVMDAAGTEAVSIDNVVMGLNGWGPTTNDISWSTNPYSSAAPGFGADPGPFAHGKFKFKSTEMYLVARLDGPRGVTGAMELVDQALYAGRYLSAQAGYFGGNVYVDSRFGNGTALYTDAYLAAQPEVQGGAYGSYASTDLNIAYGEHYVGASGFPLKWENTTGGANIGAAGAQYSDGTSGLTAPNALFYGGWYNYNNYNDVWSWLPGSVACDLDSDSLYYWETRSATPHNFGASALMRGASAVAGVVGEPYTTGHPRPNVLLYYLLAGSTFAEASALATPSIGWMPTNIGDPLYAPLRSRPLAKDTQSPVLTSVTVGAATTSAVVSLAVEATPEPEVVTAKVAYGTTASYGVEVSSGQGFWRRPVVTLPGLTGSTTYHYRVTVTDPAGNATAAGDQTFTTMP